MSEHLPKRQVVGFLEEALSQREVYDTTKELLDGVFPVDYNGDVSVPDDISSLKLAHDLTQIIWPAESQACDRQTMFVVFYRTLEFAYELSTLIKPGSNESLHIGGLFGGIRATSSEEVVDVIYQKSEAYLADRPRVHAMVKAFVGQVSPRPSLEYVTSVMCGAWLKAYDEGDEIRNLNIPDCLD